MKTSRKAAIIWYRLLTTKQMADLVIKHRSIIKGGASRSIYSVTGKEIELIYTLEHENTN